MVVQAYVDPVNLQYPEKYFENNYSICINDETIIQCITTCVFGVLSPTVYT